MLLSWLTVKRISRSSSTGLPDRATSSLLLPVPKTVVLSCTIPTNISLNNTPLQKVGEFCYLGSTITSSINMDEEISFCIGKASTAFGRLQGRVWGNNLISIRTKMALFRACVASTLLYDSEWWTTHAKQERRLNTCRLKTFYTGSIRCILKIDQKDDVINKEILSRAGLSPVYATMRTNV